MGLDQPKIMFCQSTFPATCENFLVSRFLSFVWNLQYFVFSFIESQDKNNTRISLD